MNDEAVVRDPAHIWAPRLLALSLCLTVFSGHYGDIPFPVPLDRIALLAALFVTACSRHYVARLASLRWRALHALLALSIALSVGSAIWHGTLIDSVNGFALLDQVVVPAIVLVLAGVVFDSERARHVLIAGLTILGLYLAAVSVFSMTGPSWLVWPRYIMDPSVGLHFGRARGPFAEAAGNGLGLIFCGLAATYELRHKRSRAWQIVSVITIVLCLLGALLTLTRSIWVGAFLAFGVYVVADPYLRRRAPAALAGLVVAGVMVVLTVPGIASSISDRTGDQRSIDDRTTTDGLAIEIVEDWPLTGVGWGEFLSYIPEHITQPDLGPLTNVDIEAHNVLLARGAALGVPGAVLWLCVMAAGPLRVSLGRKGSAVSDEWRWLLLGATLAYLTVAMLTPLPYAFANQGVMVLTGLAGANYFFSTEGGVELSRRREGLSRA